MNDIAKEFWVRYFQAGELERYELMEELPIPKLYVKFLVSYVEDVYELTKAGKI